MAGVSKDGRGRLCLILRKRVSHNLDAAIRIVGRLLAGDFTPMTRHLLRVLAPAIFAGVMIASPAFAQLSESELVMRLNRLENQVRQLTGQVEQLQYRNSQLEQQLGRAAQGAPPAQR